MAGGQSVVAGRRTGLLSRAAEVVFKAVAIASIIRSVGLLRPSSTRPIVAWSVFAALASSACESSNCCLRRRTLVASALAPGDALGGKRSSNGLLVGSFSLPSPVIFRVFFNVVLSWALEAGWSRGAASSNVGI
jgi:hypothetical protein